MGVMLVVNARYQNSVSTEEPMEGGLKVTSVGAWWSGCASP